MGLTSLLTVSVSQARAFLCAQTHILTLGVCAQWCLAWGGEQEGHSWHGFNISLKQKERSPPPISFLFRPAFHTYRIPTTHKTCKLADIINTGMRDSCKHNYFDITLHRHTVTRMGKQWIWNRPFLFLGTWEMQASLGGEEETFMEMLKVVWTCGPRGCEVSDFFVTSHFPARLSVAFYSPARITSRAQNHIEWEGSWYLPNNSICICWASARSACPSLWITCQDTQMWGLCLWCLGAGLPKEAPGCFYMLPGVRITNHPSILTSLETPALPLE